MNMKHAIRIALLILLLPYVVWIAGQDQLHPRAVFATLVVIAVLAPVLASRIFSQRVRSTVAGIVGSPVLIGLALFIFAAVENDRETLAWLPLIQAWAIALTAPVWIVLSVVFCGMKGNQKAEQHVRQVSSEAAPSASPDEPST
jgi:uncharacterized membrane protein